MTSYVGRHAELYDLFYAAKPYASEAAFVHHCLQKYSTTPPHRLLELACGTGSHALALERYGYQIYATDYSNDMLQVARCKAAQADSTVHFEWQDMRNLALAEHFDTVFCLFDAIGYVVTNPALRQVLQGVHKCLNPEGLFIFEFWHASAMLRHYEPIRVRSIMTPEGQVLRISETLLDPAAQTAQVNYTIYELRNDGTYTSFQETQVNRYFLVQEMAGWLSANGFLPVKWFAGFTEEEKIVDETWHIVVVARRQNEV